MKVIGNGLISSFKTEPAVTSQNLMFELQERLASAVEMLQVMMNLLENAQVNFSRLQETLNSERKHHEALLDLASIGYLVTDLQGKICQANGYAQQQLSPCREIIGQNLAVFLDETERKRFHEDLKTRYRAAQFMKRKLRFCFSEPVSASTSFPEVTVVVEMAFQKEGEPTQLRWWLFFPKITKLEGLEAQSIL